MNAQQQSARLRPFRPVPFGRYTLLTPLSFGGMGEIFLARLEGAQGFEKLCVIKKILPVLAQDGEFVERFLNEARVLAKLSHGSIAQVLDVGLSEGDPYIALEYVDGKDLRRVLARARDRGSPLPLSFTLYVMGRVLDALAYAHRKRDEEDRELHLVHRDISPQNILISYEGEVKVIDFGLAKSTLSAARTHPSMILGKFLYMSPEQARHQKVDHRADLYAAGLCLYELLSGQNPFDNGSTSDLMQRVTNPYITPLEAVVADVPRTVLELVSRALEIDPEERFQSAEEFRGRVQACLMEVAPSAGPETVSKFMLEAFAADHQQERKLLGSLRSLSKPWDGETKIGPELGLSGESDTAVVALHLVAPNADAVRTLLEVPAPERETGTPSAPPVAFQPVPLSFVPTSRSREGADSRTVVVQSPARRETLDAMPAVRMGEAATGVLLPPDDDKRDAGDDTLPAVTVPTNLRAKPRRSPSSRRRFLPVIVAAGVSTVLVLGALAWSGAEAEPDVTIEAKPATVGVRRTPGPDTSRQVKALREEWKKLKPSFQRLKTRHGCSAAAMRAVCAQAQALEVDLKQLDGAEEERVERMSRMLEDLRGEVAQLSRKGTRR